MCIDDSFRHATHSNPTKSKGKRSKNEQNDIHKHHFCKIENGSITLYVS